MPTTLRAGEIAIIGYNTGQNLSTPNTEDKLYFVLLKPIDAGTRSSSPTAAGTARPSPPPAAATGPSPINNTGKRFPPAPSSRSPRRSSPPRASTSVTRPATPSTPIRARATRRPTSSTRPSSPTATPPSTAASSIPACTAGTTAIAIQHDSGAYAGPTTHAGSFLYNGAGSTLLHSIADQNNWTGDDVDGVNANEQFVQTGPWLVHHDVEFYGVGNPGGSGIFNVVSDATHSSGIDTFNYSQIYNNALVGGVTPVMFHPNDIVFDTVSGKYFIADSDITGGHNRILQGNIADLNGNPGTVPTLTVLYPIPGTTTAARMDNSVVDSANDIVYFTHGGRVEKVNYNTASQPPTVLFDADVGGQSGGQHQQCFTDMEINFATGHIYMLSARATVSLNGDNPSKNHLYDLSGLTTGSGTNSFTLRAAMRPTCRSTRTTTTPAPLRRRGEAFPEEDGLLAGIALDAVNNILYFSTGSLLFDHDGNSGTPPLLTKGGIFSYALTGNPNGNYTQIYEPIDDGNDGSDAISEANGPQGLLDDIEISTVTGKWYVVDFTGDTNGGVQNDGDEGIWSGNSTDRRHQLHRRHQHAQRLCAAGLRDQPCADADRQRAGGSP